MIIGLTGLAGSGKSEAAKFFTERGFDEYKMAGPLKRAIATMFSLPEEALESEDREQVLEPYGKSLRTMMQTLGTEWGRNLIHEDLWVLIAEAHYRSMRDVYDGNVFAVVRLVVSDIRFENEAKWIRDRGGLLIHLSRPEGDGRGLVHASENGVAFDVNHDISLVNDATISKLHFRLSVLTKVPHAIPKVTSAAQVAQRVITDVAAKHRLKPEQMLEIRSRNPRCLAAKREAIGILYKNTSLTLQGIADATGMSDKTSVNHHLIALGLKVPKKSRRRLRKS